MKLTGLIPYGLHHMFAGMRRGKSMWAAFGAVALVAGLASRFRSPKKERLTKRKLKDGRGVKVVMLRDS